MFEQISFQPVLSWLGIMAIAAGLGALLFVRPNFAGITPGRQRFLTLIRTAVISLAVLAMLRPGCVSTTSRKQSAQVRMVADLSRSMDLPHRSDRSRRWDAMKEMLESNRELLAGLAKEDIEIDWSGFDSQLKPLDHADGIAQLPADPTGSESELAQALYSTVRNSRDKRVIAIIPMSDGVPNSEESPVDINDAISVTVDREIPIFPIPFGMTAGVGDTADVAITNLPDHHTVAVKNRLAVRATVASRGYANQQLTVQLAISRAGESEKIVDTRFVTPIEASEQQAVDLYVVPEEPGQYRMTVRVLPMSGEIALRNNELTSFLSVEDGGLRVLMLVGNLNAEQIYLRKAIPAAAQGIDLQFLVIYPVTRGRWPIGDPITTALRDPTYDVIVMMDLDSRALYEVGKREENIAALEQHVGGGKGLLMMGGDHSFGPGLWHSTPLEHVLPILMDKSERQDFGEEIQRSAHIERPLKLVPVENHFLTRLSDDDNAAAWKRLPPLVCANRFARLKAGSKVLLESEAGEAVLVEGGFGAGRVVAFAGDSTWRWWLKGYQNEYKTFWRQLLYYLAFRDGQSNDLVRIQMPRRRFQPESAVSFAAEAWTSTGDRIDDAKFESWLVNPAGEKTNVQLTSSGERDWAELDRKLVMEPGVYTINVQATRAGVDIGSTQREFSISDSDREKANPAADHEFLQRLADQTSEFGGRVVPPEEFGALIAELKKNLPEMQVKIPVKWQLGQTASDSSAFLVLFVGLLATEWFLRKRWGLV